MQGLQGKQVTLTWEKMVHTNYNTITTSTHPSFCFPNPFCCRIKDNTVASMLLLISVMTFQCVAYKGEMHKEYVNIFLSFFLFQVVTAFFNISNEET